MICATIPVNLQSIPVYIYKENGEDESNIPEVLPVSMACLHSKGHTQII